MKALKLFALFAFILPAKTGLFADSSLFIERKMDAMKGTSALTATLPPVSSILPSDIPPTDIEAPIKNLIYDQQIELAKLKIGLGRKGFVSTTPYMDKAKNSKNPKQNLAYIATQLNELKKKTFNKKLEAYDYKVQLFHKGGMSMASYIELLTQSKKADDDKSIYPQIEFFRKLQKRELTIDFTAVERERALVVRRLAYRMNERGQRELRHMVLAYRLGDVTHKTFYNYLEMACRTSGIKLETYPAIQAYMHYIYLSDHLNNTTFINKIHNLKQACYLGLTKSHIEMALIKQSRCVINLAKRIDAESSNQSVAWSGN
jgi:hypothetical protein